MSCIAGRDAELTTIANRRAPPASYKSNTLRREVAGDVEDQLRDPGGKGIDRAVSGRHDRQVRGDQDHDHWSSTRHFQSGSG